MRLPRSNLAIAVTLLLLLLIAGLLLRAARPSTEAVRLRNALLFEVGQASDFGWTPDERPASFQTDSEIPQQPFGPVVEQLRLAEAPDDWQRALIIARHLVRHARSGQGAMADLAGSYRTILAGGGYCADYTTVFIAIARRAGLFVREWAFSFDGFGGHGHALVEVWDRGSRSWRMLDVFNNWAPLDSASGQPLSADEFRRRLLAGQQSSVRIEPIGLGRFGFRDAADLWRYYGSGANQWYLWWGNAVYAYDQAWPSRWLGGRSRAAEQLAAVFAGSHPRIRALPTPLNEPMRERMLGLRWRLIAAALVGSALGLLLSLQLGLRLRDWRRARRLAHA